MQLSLALHCHVHGVVQHSLEGDAIQALAWHKQCYLAVTYLELTTAAAAAAAAADDAVAVFMVCSEHHLMGVQTVAASRHLSPHRFWCSCAQPCASYMSHPRTVCRPQCVFVLCHMLDTVTTAQAPLWCGFRSAARHVYRCTVLCIAVSS
jgi:hypothetical protein